MTLGELRPWSEKHCGYGLTKAECAELPVVHFLTDQLSDDPTETATLQACERHAPLARAHAIGEHPFVAGVCGEPDAFWFTAEDETKGSWCFISDERPARRTPEAVSAWLDR